MDETILLPLCIESQGIVYEDRNQKIQKINAVFDGFKKEYYVSDYGQRVAVVVVKKNEVLLVRQYRLLINDISYEIPGGRVDENETLEIAAFRECLEETGVKCFNLTPLLSYHPSLDTLKNYTTIFFSGEVEDIQSENREDRVWVPLSSCLEMVMSKKITDSLSIIALLMYYFRYKEKEDTFVLTGRNVSR